MIIPAYNEEASVHRVVNAILGCGHGFLDEVIVVDDGSSDRTAEVAKSAGAHVIRHPRNLGYGAAIKSGLRNARTEFVLTMDADGQHDPQDLARLWERAPQNAMVVGQRTALVHSPLWRMPGKWLLRALANHLTAQRIPDLNSGLRIIRRSVAMMYLHLCPSGFSFSTTITMALLSRGFDVEYVPIQVQPRTGKSLVSLATGFETLLLIIRIAALFGPLRVFVPASLVIGTIGIFWGVPYALLGRGVSTGSMMAIVTAILLFSLGILCDQISQMRLERYE